MLRGLALTFTKTGYEEKFAANLEKLPLAISANESVGTSELDQIILRGKVERFQRRGELLEFRP